MNLARDLNPHDSIPFFSFSNPPLLSKKSDSKKKILSQAYLLFRSSQLLCRITCVADLGSSRVKLPRHGHLPTEPHLCQRWPRHHNYSASSVGPAAPAPQRQRRSIWGRCDRERLAPNSTQRSRQMRRGGERGGFIKR